MTIFSVLGDGMVESKSVKAFCNRSMAMLERRNIMGGLSLCPKETKLLEDPDMQEEKKSIKRRKT